MFGCFYPLCRYFLSFCMDILLSFPSLTLPTHHTTDLLKTSKNLRPLTPPQYSTANSILTLSRFVELKHTSGTFASPHFIFPKLKTLQKWVFGLFSGDPSSGPNLGNLDDEQMEISETVYLGASFSPPKDPEHLPPRNALQRFGDGIRVIPRFLGGESVRFGVRGRF